MIRPIRVAPLSNVQVSQQPLVPNNMTSDQYLANQFASGNFAQPTAMAVSRPLPQSPVQAPTPTAATQQLSQIGQQGAQGAQERVSKRITQSPRVQGLLGGGQGAGGLLSDINNQAGLQGLFATMQAIGRPVARGEDRLLGAVEYGRGVQQQAREQGIQNLSTQMKLEEMQRQREREQLRREALEGIAQRTQAPQPTELSTFSTYAISQMDENQMAVAQQAEALSREADRLALVDAELSQQFRDQAGELRNQATAGLLTRSDAVSKEENLRKEFVDGYVEETNGIIQRRNSLMELLKQGGPVSKYLTFVSAIKTVEPNSAVLSSEYESAQALSGLLTRLQTQLEGIKGDQPLPEQFVTDMQNVGNLMAEAAMEHYEKGASQYKGIATRQNLNPDNVIIAPTSIRGATGVPQVEITQDDEDVVDSILGGNGS